MEKAEGALAPPEALLAVNSQWDFVELNNGPTDGLCSDTGFHSVHGQPFPENPHKTAEALPDSWQEAVVLMAVCVLTHLLDRWFGKKSGRKSDPKG